MACTRSDSEGVHQPKIHGNNTAHVRKYEHRQKQVGRTANVGLHVQNSVRMNTE